MCWIASWRPPAICKNIDLAYTKAENVTEFIVNIDISAWLVLLPTPIQDESVAKLLVKINIKCKIQRFVTMPQH